MFVCVATTKPKRTLFVLIRGQNFHTLEITTLQPIGIYNGISMHDNEN